MKRKLEQPAAGSDARASQQQPRFDYRDTSNNTSATDDSSRDRVGCSFLSCTSSSSSLTTHSTTNAQGAVGSAPGHHGGGCGFPFAFRQTRHDDINKPTQAVPSSNPPETERLLAKEMNDLTITQRQKVYEDVHGVAGCVEETPVFVATKIAELLEEIRLFCNRKQNRLTAFAYEQALFLCPQRIHSNPDFLLMFLRCEEFDAKLAAQRLVSFFQLKLDFFGTECLSKDITLDDLSEQDKEFLHQGFLQILPVPDRSGRPILIICNKHAQSKDPMNLTRTTWYIITTVLRTNLAAQQKGVVFVALETIKGGSVPTPELMFLKKGPAFFASIPMRMSAYHFCYDNPAFHPAISLIHIMVGRQSRVRFRSHYGSETECMYRLLTFGIQGQHLPITSDGYLDLSQHHAWINSRRDIEAKLRQQPLGTDSFDDARQSVESQSLASAIVPTFKDILLGKGRPYQEFPGNRQMDKIVLDHWEIYESCSKTEKTKLFRNLVGLLKEQGTRFLKKSFEDTAGDNPAAKALGRWVEVDDASARKKVGHSFRNRPVISNYHKNKDLQKATTGDDQEGPASKGTFRSMWPTTLASLVANTGNSGVDANAEERNQL